MIKGRETKRVWWELWMSQGKRRENIVSECPKEKKGPQHCRPVKQKWGNEWMRRTAISWWSLQCAELEIEFSERKGIHFATCVYIDFNLWMACLSSQWTNQRNQVWFTTNEWGSVWPQICCISSALYQCHKIKFCIREIGTFAKNIHRIRWYITIPTPTLK